MRIAGIDCSTFAIDIVTVPLDEGDAPQWHHWMLVGSDAFDRTRRVGGVMPTRGSFFWDDILACGIEQPGGQQRHVTARVQGAVLSMIPSRMLVHPLQPSEWRAKVGLSGGASKEDVASHSLALLGMDHSAWTQDAHDAHCMALATRALVLAEQEKEARRDRAGHSAA